MEINGEVESVSGGIEKQDVLQEKDINPEKISIKISNVIQDDDVEGLKKIIEKYDESCRNSLLKVAIPVVIFDDDAKLKCMEYLLQVYDEMDDRSRELVDTLTSTVEIVKRFMDSTYLHHIATSYSSQKLMNILQKHKNLIEPVLNQKDQVGTTPLHVAVKWHNVDIAKCLIQCEADVLSRNNRGETPVYLAALNGQVEILEEILQKYSRQHLPKAKVFKDPDSYGKGHTILYPALQGGNTEIYDYLMKEEDAAEMFRIEVEHRDFWKIVHCLCRKGMKQVLQTLIKRDDNLFAQVGKDGDTPLMWAASEHQLEIIQLISRTQGGRKTINQCDKQGRNLIHYALKYPRVLEYIFETFPELNNDVKVINKLDNRGMTPLKLCAIEGFQESAIVLLRNGCVQIFRGNSNCDNNYNFFQHVEKMNFETLRGILTYLEENANDALLFSLKRENTKYQPPLSAAARNGRDDLVNLLLDKGANGEQLSSRENWTALHFAVDGKSLSTVEILLRRVPQVVNWTSWDNRTAVMLAVQKGQHKIVKRLLEKGAAGVEEKEQLLLVALGLTHYTRARNHTNTISEIISSLDMNGTGTTLKSIMKKHKYLMEILVRGYPKAAVKVLDKCLQKRYTKGEFYLEINEYDFFPIKADEEGHLQAIERMVEYQRDKCLAHPVVEKFVQMKWRSPAVRNWYFINMLLYVIFLVCFTSHIILYSADTISETSAGLLALSVFSLTVCSFNMIKELIQIRVVKKRYFRDFSNYVEWTMYFAAFVYFIPLSGKRNGQIQAGAIGVFLAWINLIWFLKRFSGFGIYIIMAKKVFITLLKVMPMVILFIIAFSVVFLVLMSNDQGFETFFISMLTTSVMVVGELEYRSVFLEAKRSPFHLLQKIFLVLIVMVGGIVLMNLLVGLAVGDTDSIMKRSQAEKRLHQASVVTSLEKSLRSFSFLWPPWELKFHEEKIKHEPSKETGFIQQDPEDPKNNGDKLLARVDTLEESIKSNTLQLENMQRLLGKIDNMERLLEKINVSVQ